MAKDIKEFKGFYSFLSNFFRFEATFTVEHLFQSFKATDPKEIKWILESRTPGTSKSRGRAVELREDWDDGLDIDVMRHFVYAKFIFNKNLKQALIDTHPRNLIEGNVWKDKKWGKVNGKGRNEHGKLLMELRDLFMEDLEENE